MARESKSESFIMVTNAVYGSAAFRQLKPAAKLVYLELCHRRGPANNGAIDMTTRQAMEATGYAEPAVTEALRQLRRHGLVVRTHCADRSIKASKRGDHSRWMITAFPYRSEAGRPTAALALYVEWTGEDGSPDFLDYQLDGGVRRDQTKMDRAQGFTAPAPSPKPRPGPMPQAANVKPVLKPFDPEDTAIASTRREKRGGLWHHDALNASGDVVAQTWTRQPDEKPDFALNMDLDVVPF